MAPKAKASGKARAKSSGSKAGESLATTPGYTEVLKRLKETFDESVKKDNEDPQSLIEQLKSERAAAQQIVREKTNEIRNLLRKVARLATKGKAMSDDGLLLEYRRRKLIKERAAASKLARQNAFAIAQEDPS